MGGQQSILGVNKAGYEDVQAALASHKSQGSNSRYVLINTLSATDQDCLIQGSITSDAEEEYINRLLTSTDGWKKRETIIIVYGRNNTDESALVKCQQLSVLGFTESYVYIGGLFEWLMLQDIYGAIEFPTTSKQLNLLRYKTASNVLK